jgi:hypothetical protein
MKLWRVKFTYCITVDAESPEAAYKAVCKQIAGSPQMVISSIEDARYGNQRPVWKRLLTGR